MTREYRGGKRIAREATKYEHKENEKRKEEKGEKEKER